MAIVDTNSWLSYAWHVAVFLAGFLALIGYGLWRSRLDRPSWFDRYETRKRRDAEQSISDPVLAAHRRHGTRLTRTHDTYTGPRQLDENRTRR